MTVHHVDGAPAAIGPYCHAISAGGLVFLSGQTPLDPDTMELVGADVAEQTERVLDNIEIVLGGLGLTLQNVVKCTVFLKDMGDFKAMNAVYARRFAGHTPARSAIAVRQNPLDALVEIECIAEAGAASQ
ncbi:MAG: RidA family protein [Rhodothermales bacterium]|nr:RidA family protein [Rhodothermales bacterium]MBO6779297.1 RidA family protein [Rhodothermales bacterium]